MGSVAEALGDWVSVEVTLGSEVLVSVGMSCLVRVGLGDVIGGLGVAGVAVTQAPNSKIGSSMKHHVIRRMAEIIPDGMFRINKFAKPSKFLSPLQADGVLRNFAPSGRVFLKRGTHVASYGVFASLNKPSYFEDCTAGK
jgi:hypothetical protein